MATIRVGSGASIGSNGGTNRIGIVKGSTSRKPTSTVRRKPGGCTKCGGGRRK